MTDTLIRKLTADGKFLRLEDGFLRFWVDNLGAFSAHDLRAIADHLDRENKPWQDELNEYFDKLQSPEAVSSGDAQCDYSASIS